MTGADIDGDPDADVDGDPDADVDADPDADVDVEADIDVGDGADTDVEVALIAAVASNRVIGRDKTMPWHFSEDLEYFKRTTTGHPVIVGRRTYETVVEALGEPFPDRTSVVLTSQSLELPAGAVVANSIEEAIDLAAADADERGVNAAYVAGGGRVYDQLLPYATRLVLTEIHEAYEGDTRFPAWDDDEWVEIDRDKRDALDFVTYERLNG